MEGQRVVVQDEFGGPDVLRMGRRPVPVPLPTEIQVRVEAAGVNPVDAKTRAGAGMSSILGPPPFVLGWDVAGTVEQVGRGVTRFRAGDLVMGMPWFPRQAGAYAQFVTAPSRQFVAVPAALSVTEAGALPLAGLTAWQALVDAAQLEAGQRVLIHAAGGGVGHLAVQIAKSRDAWVAAVASARKRDFLLGLGADLFIDRHAPWSVSNLQRMDVVLDLVGGEVSERSLGWIRPGGSLVVVAGPASDQLRAHARELAINVDKLLVEPDAVGLEALAVLAREGGLRPWIQRTFALEEAASAHRSIEAGATRGKLVLLSGA